MGRVRVRIDPASLARLQATLRSLSNMKATIAEVACRMEAAFGPPTRAPERPGDRAHLIAWLDRAKLRP